VSQQRRRALYRSRLGTFPGATGKGSRAAEQGRDGLRTWGKLAGLLKSLRVEDNLEEPGKLMAYPQLVQGHRQGKGSVPRGGAGAAFRQGGAYCAAPLPP
jgi:hypothetical protein